MKCLNYLIDTPEKQIESDKKAIESLKYRYKLWDKIKNKILENNKTLTLDEIN